MPLGIATKDETRCSRPLPSKFCQVTISFFDRQRSVSPKQPGEAKTCVHISGSLFLSSFFAESRSKRT